MALLTSPSGAAVAGLIPEVDEVIVYEAPWVKATPPRESPAPDFALIEQLRRARFDAAVIFTVFSQNPLPAALMAYLAEIPLRAAYSRENPYQLLTHPLPDPYPQDAGQIPHEVRRHLDLAASLGCAVEDESLSLRVPPGAYAQARTCLASAGIDPARPWVVVHPGASAPSRRYPPQAFAAVVRRLALEHGWQVAISGGPGEVPLAGEVRQASGAPAVSLAGQLDLAAFAALLDLAPMLISNNTGPVHLAAALDTPVVDIYALTNPQHMPWGVPNRVIVHEVPCKYCYKSVCPLGHHDCLRLIPPDEVVRAAVELAAETGQGRPDLRRAGEGAG